VWGKGPTEPGLEPGRILKKGIYGNLTGGQGTMNGWRGPNLEYATLKAKGGAGQGQPARTFRNPQGGTEACGVPQGPKEEQRKKAKKTGTKPSGKKTRKKK